HGILECQSPDVIAKLLKEELQQHGYEPDSLRVLDLGAGNGLVGERLRNIGVGTLVGVDIIAEAREAAMRDRPDVYDEYHVADMTALPTEVHERLASPR